MVSLPANVCPVLPVMRVALAPGGKHRWCINVVSEPESNRTQSGGRESCFCIDFTIANEHGVTSGEMDFDATISGS